MTAGENPDLPIGEVRVPDIDAAAATAVPVEAVDEDGQAVIGTADALTDDPYVAALAAELGERTTDLQRLQAEYANYRRRVERDREQVREQAVASTLADLLPVLDDIGRAREHGELTGGFRSVGEALEAAVAKLGLERFGEPGEPFDPSVHEAISHTHSPEVTETTAVAVFQPGYRFAGRVVRPARVAVADPE